MNEKLQAEISRVVDIVWSRQSLGRRKIRDGLVTNIHGGTPIQFDGEDLFRFDLELDGKRTYAYVQNGEDQEALAFEFNLLEMGLNRADAAVTYVALPMAGHDAPAVMVLSTDI